MNLLIFVLVRFVVKMGCVLVELMNIYVIVIKFLWVKIVKWLIIVMIGIVLIMEYVKIIIIYIVVFVIWDILG